MKSSIIKSIKKSRRPNKGMTKSIVRKGIRKASPIKKYEDMYYVPISYFGLIEMRKNENSSWNEYRGWATKDSPNGPIDCTVWMRISQVGSGDSYRYDDFVIDGFKEHFPEYADVNIWEDKDARMEYEDYRKVIAENMAGVMSVEIEGGFSFSIIRDNDKREILSQSSVDKGMFFSSVDEFIQWVSDESATAWGDAMVNYSEFNEKVIDCPDVIRIDVPEGEFLLKKEYNYLWEGSYRTSDDNIYFDSKIRLEGMKQERYKTDSPIGYYVAKVVNEIDDTNEHKYGDEYGYGNSEGDTNWFRIFDLENMSLEGIIASMNNAVMETYNEYRAYVESTRNYVKVSRGRGSKADIINENEWVYYPTDAMDYGPAPDYEYNRYMDWSDGKYYHQNYEEPSTYIDDWGRYGQGNRLIMSTKKSISKPKSFNSMVKSIRHKNNKKKVL